MVNGLGVIAGIGDGFAELTCANKDIAVVLLVGSYARGSHRADSDIDLIILTDEWRNYVNDHRWAGIFGDVMTIRTEYYGLITSVRIQYGEYEVEFGFGSPRWLSTPLDPGTERVLSDGYRILYDRDQYTEEVRRLIKPV